MDKTQADLDLYFLTRNVQWRYRLDQYEDATIREMLKTVRSTVAEIKREIFENDAPENADALIAELEALSAGLRKRIGEDVATMASVAGEYSVAEHTAIMSLDGAVKISTVALSAAQFKEFLGGPTQGTPLPAWVDAAWGEAVSEKIRRNLNVAVLRGEGYQKAVRGLLDAGLADFSEREAITIARTYVQTANVAAQMAVYQENDDLVKGWRWSSVLEPGYSKSGRGTCMSCASLDGRVFDLGKGPSIPLHPRCLTGETPVNAPDKVAAFVAPYSGPIIEIGLPDGTNISVTPNHMFLTDKGFVAAKDLNEGSQIFYNAGANGPVGLVGPDDHGKPAPIKEIVEAMAKAPGMRTIRVPHAPEYFHGDGELFQGYVDVIAPDCLLRREGDTAIPEQSPEGELIFSDIVKLALSPECDFTHPLLWLWLSTGCHVSGKSVSEVLFPGPSGHHDPVSLGWGALRDPGLIEAAFDYDSIYSEHSAKFVGVESGLVQGDNLCNGNVDSSVRPASGFYPVPFERPANSTGRNSGMLRDFAIRHAGVVQTANIRFKRVRYFSGHVYDLQTLSSMYHVAGLLSSNCRCVAIPVTKTWRELGIDRDEIDDAIRPYTIRPDKNIDAGGMRTIIESGRHQGDYASWWAKQSEEFKRNAVGPGRYELLKSGKIKFEDLVDSLGNARTLKELSGATTPAKAAKAATAAELHPYEVMKNDLAKKYGADKIYSMATDSELEAFEGLERSFYEAQKQAQELSQASIKIKAVPGGHMQWAENDDIYAAIQESMDKAWDEDGRSYFGLRVQTNLSDVFNEKYLKSKGVNPNPKKSSLVKVGDELEPSYVWVDNELTDEMLEGTSTIIVKSGNTKSIQHAVKRINEYSGRQVILVSGDDMTYGEDEDEAVLKGAKAIAVWMRK